jgi:DNA repair protein RecO (recombination protein O)
MTETATGLVLRTRPLTETSLIVQWLTPNLGRLATVAKGARRPKSPFRGKLDLFYLAEFSFNRSQRSELHQLREVKLLETRTALREEIGYLQQGSYCAALVEQTTETETPLPVAFELMNGLLEFLPTGPTQPQTVLAFELKLLDELGLTPDLDKTHLTPGSREIIRLLGRSDWNGLARLRLSAGQVKELGDYLHGFLIYHLEKIPRGRGQAIGAGRE